ncbi:hypothetical protein, partial [Motilimonas sp. E26]|uniref:hypothetical protein n=1 Tax=Motilimonas sp. E26 TaxID=2865674 RepID=UPI001E3DA1C3
RLLRFVMLLLGYRLQQTHIEALLVRSHRCLLFFIHENNRGTRQLSVNLVLALFKSKVLKAQLVSGSAKV